MEERLDAAEVFVALCAVLYIHVIKKLHVEVKCLYSIARTVFTGLREKCKRA